MPLNEVMDTIVSVKRIFRLQGQSPLTKGRNKIGGIESIQNISSLAKNNLYDTHHVKDIDNPVTVTVCCRQFFRGGYQ